MSLINTEKLEKNYSEYLKSNVCYQTKMKIEIVKSAKGNWQIWSA